MPPERSESQEEERPEREGGGRTEPEAVGVPGTTQDRGESVGEPDVLLDVPVLNVEELDLDVEDLRARVSYGAELADMVKINVGIDAEVGKAKINIQGLEVQAQLKARLDNVRAIFGEVLATLQANPELARDMLRAPGETPGRETQDEPGRPGGASRVGHAAPDEPATGGASSLADLPIEEEYVDGRGRIVGRARDEGGEYVEEILDEEGNAPDRGTSTGTGEVTDAARRRADELGLSLSGVRGTGSGGRILLKDVEDAGRNGA